MMPAYRMKSLLPTNEPYLDDLRQLAEHVNGFVYHGERLEAALDTIRALRDRPELAERLLRQ